jgi:hypothetical protein
MTLDASGNLGVGSTSPAQSWTGDPARIFQLQGSTQVSVVRINSSGGSYGDLQLVSSASSEVGIYNFANGAMRFGTNNTERARITSGGSLLVGDTTDSAKLWVYRTDDGNTIGARATSSAYAAAVGFFGADRNTTNNTFYYIDCYNYGSSTYRFRVADSGNVTNTNGSYGTISDAKMKTDIVDAGSQWDDLKAVRFRKFKMKDDPEQIVQLGVVAQELEQTSPGLVEEHADRDAEGNDLGTTTKSVKTSVLLMKAAVALQEAMARIEKLEAEVAALKRA